MTPAASQRHEPHVLWEGATPPNAACPLGPTDPQVGQHRNLQEASKHRVPPEGRTTGVTPQARVPAGRGPSAHGEQALGAGRAATRRQRPASWLRRVQARAVGRKWEAPGSPRPAREVLAPACRPAPLPGPGWRPLALASAGPTAATPSAARPAALRPAPCALSERPRRPRTWWRWGRWTRPAALSAGGLWGAGGELHGKRGRRSAPPQGWARDGAQRAMGCGAVSGGPAAPGSSPRAPSPAPLWGPPWPTAGTRPGVG